MDDTAGLDDSGSGSGGTATAGSTSGTAGSSGTTGSSGEVATGTTGFDPSGICPQDYDPVCGKDGETYDNACVAGTAGVEIRREGPCLGDCEGSCVVAPQGPSLLGLVLLVLALLRPRR